MRAVLIAIMALAGTIALAGEPPEQPAAAADFAPLSKRFLAALQSEKIEDCMACWLSVDRMTQLYDNPPAGLPKPPAEERAEFIKYFRERDRVIVERFPKFIAVLKANGADPKTLAYERSEGVFPKRKQGLEMATTVIVVFKTAGGAMVKFTVDDACKLDGRWHFTDKPFPHIQFTRDGKRREVQVDMK